MAAILKESPNGREALPAVLQPLMEQLLSKKADDRPSHEHTRSELQRLVERPELLEASATPERIFVGRESELRELRNLAERLRSGKGSLALVAGARGLVESDIDVAIEDTYHGAKFAKEGAHVFTLGLVLLGLFVVMRVIGGFGNHHPAPGSSLIDFLNVTKYPPSMAFLSLTLSINLILLGLLPRLPSAWRRVLDVYGKSPLFFYLAHIWLFTLIGLPFRQGTGYGVLYLVWVCGMIPLLFACTRSLPSSGRSRRNRFGACCDS